MPASHFCQIRHAGRASDIADGYREFGQPKPRQTCTGTVMMRRLGYRCAPMSPPTSPDSAPPRLRRAYFECRYGQLHVHNAIPAGGGFDEQTTLICLHASSTTGRMFLELSKLLGTTRSIYSPDTPGCGESDPPPTAAADRRLLRGHRRFHRFDALPPGGLVRRAFRRGGGGRAGHNPAQDGAPRRHGRRARPRCRGATQLPRTCRRRRERRRGALWARAAVIDWNADRAVAAAQTTLVSPAAPGQLLGGRRARDAAGPGRPGGRPAGPGQERAREGARAGGEAGCRPS